MTIDNKNKILFIHIPRTGGSSIEKCFGHYRNQNSLYGRKVINSNLYALQHLTLEEHIKFNYISNPNKYFKCAFVRNPWSRLVSAYSYQNRNGKITSFNAFVKKASEYILNNKLLLPTNEYDILKKNYGISLVHLIPQSNFVKHKNIKLDFIGKFENYQLDLKIILEKFNIKTEIPKINKSKHTSYTEYYDEDLKNLVSKMYKEDINRFNYSYLCK